MFVCCNCCNATEDILKKGQLRVWKMRGKLVTGFVFGVFLGGCFDFLLHFFKGKKTMLEGEAFRSIAVLQVLM